MVTFGINEHSSIQFLQMIWLHSYRYLYAICHILEMICHLAVYILGHGFGQVDKLTYYIFSGETGHWFLFLPLLKELLIEWKCVCVAHSTENNLHQNTCSGNCVFLSQNNPKVIMSSFERLCSLDSLMIYLSCSNKFWCYPLKYHSKNYL